MTEWEKAQAGYLYDANFDPEIVQKRTRCADLCYEFNHCKPSDTQAQQRLLHQIFGEIKGDIVVTAPFYCDYGFNISVGNNFYTNHNCTILDAAKVEIGDSVFLAPTRDLHRRARYRSFTAQSGTGICKTDSHWKPCLDWSQCLCPPGCYHW